MKLTHDHTAALLNALEKAQEEKQTAEACLRKNEDENMDDWFEISVFMADERIKLIKKSIIDQDIDF